MSSPERPPANSALDELMLTLAGTAKSIDPSDVAKAALPGDAGWTRLLPQVRATAVHLARAGRLVILRKGKPVDPDGFKGVYRLALPSAAAAQGEGNSADDLPVSR